MHSQSIKKKQIDVGGNILQIRGCFDVDEILEADNKKRKKYETLSKVFDENQPLFVMVRTPNFCKIIKCSKIDDDDDDIPMTKANDDRGINCMDNYVLDEVERVELSYGSSIRPFKPTFIAANPVTPRPYFFDPSFTILSRSASSRPI